MRPASAYLTLLLLLVPLTAAAQRDWGSVSGGLESNSVYETDGHFRSNNYLKLDYVLGHFSAGVQAEYYPDPLPGYSAALKGFGLPEKYISFAMPSWSVTAGDFYEQFGTGILLRSWEDRTLGWNNSIGGGRASFQTRDGVFALKALGGYAREGLRYSSNALAGADAALHLGAFTLEGAAVTRWLPDARPDPAGSALVAYDSGAFSARGEWVAKKGGNAQTLELAYAQRGFSSAVTLRRLEKMEDPMEMNYLPALSMEQSYMLATLNPYTTFGAGECGGNASLFYNYKRWKFHLNGSMIYALPVALAHYDHPRMAYRDINLEVEKRWGRRLKTVAFVSIQENSPSHGDRKATNAQNVFVLDGRYKFPKKLSLRAQLQYLYSEELTRDWMAGSLELASTSGWSIHVQDMYNHGDTKAHYYEVALSWTRAAFKADLSYGHQRAGFVCSGGVCRWQPEYRGAMLRLTYQFSR